MTKDERVSAVELANRLLDEPNADPDDDLRVLSRQLLRRHEEIDSMKRKWGEHPNDGKGLQRVSEALKSDASTSSKQCVTCDGTGQIGIPGGPCYICGGSGQIPTLQEAPLRDRVIAACIASCSCPGLGTKSTEPRHHDGICRYRVLMECLTLLDAEPDEPEQIHRKPNLSPEMHKALDEWETARASMLKQMRQDETTADCPDCMKCLEQEERATAYADQLTAMIGVLVGQDMGEHSSENEPWENAIEALRVAIGSKQSSVEPSVSNPPAVTLSSGLSSSPARESLVGLQAVRSPLKASARPVPDHLKAPVFAADKCPAVDDLHTEHKGKCMYCGAPMPPEKASADPGVSHPGCNYLAPTNGVCNKCGWSAENGDGDV